MENIHMIIFLEISALPPGVVAAAAGRAVAGDGGGQDQQQQGGHHPNPPPPTPGTTGHPTSEWSSGSGFGDWLSGLSRGSGLQWTPLHQAIWKRADVGLRLMMTIWRNKVLSQVLLRIICGKYHLWQCVFVSRWHSSPEHGSRQTNN